MRVEGGEVGFVRRMIEESSGFKEKVKVYTVLLGHKSSVAEVRVAHEHMYNLTPVHLHIGTPKHLHIFAHLLR